MSMHVQIANGGNSELAYSVKPGGHIWFEFLLKQEGMAKSADVAVGFSVRVSCAQILFWACMLIS
jgi:hypothetical protein